MIVDFVKAQKEDNIIEKAKFNLLFQLIFMDQNARCCWNEQDIVFSVFKNIENLKVLTFFPSTGSYRPILTLGPVLASSLLVSSIILKISKEGKCSFSLFSVAKSCPTL